MKKVNLKPIISHSSIPDHVQSIRTSSSYITSAGFTIIETLIVLAIAGLILMIVFEAIPTLERSGRNNQRKQDVAAILEAVSHYELNNSGNFPDGCGGSNPSCFSAEGGSPNNYFLQSYLSNLSYYVTDTQVQLSGLSTQSTVNFNPTSPGINSVFIYNYKKCDPNNLGSSTYVGAGYNDVVALYDLEESGNNITAQCQQL